jgi:hypothetical protein
VEIGVEFTMKRPNKSLQAIPIEIGTAPLDSEADERHNAVVAEASALPTAVPEPGR